MALVAGRQGRWRDALDWRARRAEVLVRLSPSPAVRIEPALDTAFAAAMFEGDTSRALATTVRALARHPLESMPAAERPWDLLAELAVETGDVQLARRALAGFERDLMTSAVNPEATRAYYAARVALAGRDWDEAIQRLHDADRGKVILESAAGFQLGRAHQMAGRPDSAIHYLEQALAFRDAFGEGHDRWKVPAHRWLGEAYEATGNSRGAIEQYGRFVQEWADADPELQPQVREVRGRLAELRARTS